MARRLPQWAVKHALFEPILNTLLTDTGFEELVVAWLKVNVSRNQPFGQLGVVRDVGFWGVSVQDLVIHQRGPWKFGQTRLQKALEPPGLQPCPSEAPNAGFL